MNTIRECEKCGAPLPSDAPRGLCPPCMMQAALEGTVENAKTGAAEGSPVRTGTPAGASGIGAKLRYFGDYELLEKIAQGGMGVVYKARQVKLNRAVAVKMILAGEFATEASVQRFLTEAEAAANLQHPNIVAIHEVGEQEGQHYFSMDYVEGKNLGDFVNDNLLPAARVAQLVKTIAEAIHYAHQRGTLHRDLKPQNVLIDITGQPRITDFGLAKRVEHESGLTQTGAVIGSPSYMPPEQAGKPELVGPASDVYSIGAILYHLLTGRAPFAAESPLATLRKVMDEEPAVPSKLNPKTPPDLETICLKCLEKRPEQRYASARQLAEELDRFMNHEPILARPVGLLRRAWAWSSRRPWMLTGALSVAVLGLIVFAYGLWEQNRFLIWSQSHTLPNRRPEGWPLRLFDPGLGFGAFSLFGAFAFADWVDRKRRGLAIRRFHLRVSGLVASLEIAVAIGLAVCSVHDYVWRSLKGDEIGRFMTMVLPLMWFGALLLWHVVREHRLSAFGIEHAGERILFPPVAPLSAGTSLWTVAQRIEFNRFFLAVLTLGTVAVFVLPDALLPDPWGRVWYVLIGGCALVLPLLITWFRASKSANRHLIFYAVCFFGAGGAFQLFLIITGIASSDLANRTRLIVTYGSAPAFGLMTGWLLAKLNQQQGESSDGSRSSESGAPAWVRANPRLACGAFVLTYLALALAYNQISSTRDYYGPWLGALSFSIMFIPYQYACWRRAAGSERRARLGTLWLLIGTAILVGIHVGLPPAVKAIFAGLALGLVVLLGWNRFWTAAPESAAQ